MQAKISTKQALLFTIINYIGVVIGVVSTVLIYPQDKELLGVVRFVDACAQILFPILVLGSTHALINFYPQLTKPLQGKLFSFSLRSIALLTVIVGVVLGVFSALYEGEENRYIVMGFILAISMAYIELFRRQATNLQRLSFPTFFEKIIPKLALPAVFLCVVYTSVSPSEAIWYYIAGYYSIAVVIGIYINKYFKYQWHWNYGDLFDVVSKRKYYAYSLFAFAGSFGSFFAFRVDALMIPYFISYEANGTYNIGVALASTLAIPATGVFALYAPIISDLLKHAQLKVLNVKYKEVARNLFFIGMLLFSCVVVGIEPLFKLLPTYDKLAPSIPIIYLLGLNVVVNMSTGFSTEIISYSKYYRFNLVSILTLMVLNVVLNYVLLTQTSLGILGVGIASLVSLTLFNAAKTYYIYKKIKLWPFELKYFKLLIGMLGIGLIAFYIPSTDLPLLDLLLKVGVVLILNVLIIFKTTWVLGIKTTLVQVLKKLSVIK